MSEPLPNWVIDLVNQLAEQTSHPRLLFDQVFEGVVAYDWCPCAAYELVPADVKAPPVATLKAKRAGRVNRWAVSA